MKKELLIVVFMLIAGCSFGQQFTDLYGDYLGQTPPGDTPMIFAPGIITGFVHGGMTISPKGDEVYWSVSPSYIYYSKLANGKLTEPALADFIKDYQAYQNEGPVFSPDGDKLYFSSNRPGGMGKTDTWFVEREKNGWSKPINAGKPYNSADNDRSPIFTKRGHAFCLRMDGEYRTIPLCYEYSNCFFSGLDSTDYIPEYAPWWSLFISPEEDYIIFTGDNKEYPSKGADLYIRFKNKRGRWGNPINMGGEINSKEWDRFPYVSPDGKYLFFTRGGSNAASLFWVSTGVIDKLKKEN